MYKREFLYTVILFSLIEVFTVVDYGIAGIIIIITALLILLTWIFISILMFTKKNVSRFTDVMLKLEIRKRWYSTIFMPLALFLSLVTYISEVKSDLLRQLIILFSMIMFYILFIHIKSSFQKAFSVSKNTKVILDIINVFIFFLYISALTGSGVLNLLSLFFIVFSVSSVILLANLKSMEVLNIQGFLWAVGGALLVSLVTLIAPYINVFILSFILTLTFYSVITFWHLKANGENSVSKYIEPLLFVVMALMIVIGK